MSGGSSFGVRVSLAYLFQTSLLSRIHWSLPGPSWHLAVSACHPSSCLWVVVFIFPDSCSHFPTFNHCEQFHLVKLPPTPRFLISLCSTLRACVRASCFGPVRLFAALWTVVCQAPLSMRFSRQGYWSGLPCPPPGHLPKPGIKAPSPTSPALVGRFFSSSTTWGVSDQPQTSTSGSASKAQTLRFCSWNLTRNDSFSQQHWGERAAPSITELLGICSDARHESSGPTSLFTEQQPPVYSTRDWPLPPGTLSALGWHSFNCWQKVMA